MNPEDDGIDIVGGWFPAEPNDVRSSLPPPVQRRARLAADIGQRADPTAVCTMEPTYDAAARRATFNLRGLKRLPLGTPYPEVGRYLARAAAKLSVRINGPVDIFIDATGVGRGPVDIVREELGKTQHRLYAVTIGAGWTLKARDGESIAKDGRRLLRSSRELVVGKEYLISHTKALLQTGRIQTPRIGLDPVLDAELGAMHREMTDFEIKAREGGHDMSGAKTGSHDDLVIALGLGVLLDYRGETGVDDLVTLNRTLRQTPGPGRGLRNSGL